MDAPFRIGDRVECIRATINGRVRDGEQYVISGVYYDFDWFVQVDGQGGVNFYADRFRLVEVGLPFSPVIRKIKQLETRFQQRAAR